MFDFPEKILVVLFGYEQFLTSEAAKLNHIPLGLKSNVLPPSTPSEDNNYDLSKRLLQNNAVCFVDIIETFFSCRLSAQKYN